MAVPIRYNIRNLKLRKSATIMTTAGIALTVIVAIFLMALSSGLHNMFSNTGDPLNVLVLAKGADSELSTGGINRDALGVASEFSGVSKDSSGKPLASGEVVRAVMLSSVDGSGGALVSVRFLTPAGIEMRPRVKLVSGRWFTNGKPEIVVSQTVSKRFAQANIGDSIWIGKGPWAIVGIFDAGGTAHDSEIWGDENQLSDTDRDSYSSMLIRATDPVAADALVNRMSDDQRLKLKGMLESAYYAQQTGSGGPIKFVGFVVAILMAIGSCFAAMNTMYAAVSYRSREIATLRVIGFSRLSILMSFLFESLLLSGLGAIVAILLMLPVNGLTTGTMNVVTHSEAVFALQITPAVLGIAILCALILGAFGGIAPAWNASRRQIVSALRD